MTYHRTMMALLVALATGADPALGATSFSNSLAGFTGNSTIAATQAAVGAAGFTFFSTTGLDPEFTQDPTVVFGSTGATFGSQFGGDGGRNYMRTNDADYATVSFVAEVTFETADLDIQDTFMGLGSGDTALFGWPDWSTQFSSAIFTPEINNEPLLTTMYTHNDTPVFNNTQAPDLNSGTNRMRISFDAANKTLEFAVDFNYTGGAFVSDQAAPVLDLSTLFSPPETYDAADYVLWRDTLGSTTELAANWDNEGTSMDLIDQADYAFWTANFGAVQSEGWPGEPSRIFFGGDDGVTFKDFVVTVTPAGAAGIGATPEPTAAVLVALGLLGAGLSRGRRS